jgi:hypothetical protein
MVLGCLTFRRKRSEWREKSIRTRARIQRRMLRLQMLRHVKIHSDHLPSPPTNFNISIPHISLSPSISPHTSLVICIFNPLHHHRHHHKISVHSILFLGRDHTLYASILIFYYPCRSVFFVCLRGGEGSVRLRQIGIC